MRDGKWAKGISSERGFYPSGVLIRGVRERFMRCVGGCLCHAGVKVLLTHTLSIVSRTRSMDAEERTGECDICNC